MSGAEIALEVAAALAEAGADVGNGPLVASLQPIATGGNPWDTPGDSADPVEVVIIIDQFKRHEIDGQRILSGDKKLLIEAGQIVPAVGDLITVSGQEHKVENVWPLSPGGVDLMYTVQARET